MLQCLLYISFWPSRLRQYSANIARKIRNRPPSSKQCPDKQQKATVRKSSMKQLTSGHVLRVKHFKGRTKRWLMLTMCLIEAYQERMCTTYMLQRRANEALTFEVYLTLLILPCHWEEVKLLWNSTRTSTIYSFSIFLFRGGGGGSVGAHCSSL